MLRRLLAFAALLAEAGVSAGHGGPLQRAGQVATDATNPYEGQAAAEKAGAKLFRYNCSACHGTHAEGIGKAPPLISPQTKTATPGALQWVLRNGSLTTGMPSFSKLPEARRWQIITYIKGLNSR
jgi:mono/diheme cytochrome c family protein